MNCRTYELYDENEYFLKYLNIHPILRYSNKEFDKAKKEFQINLLDKFNKELAKEVPFIYFAEPPSYGGSRNPNDYCPSCLNNAPTDFNSALLKSTDCVTYIKTNDIETAAWLSIGTKTNSFPGGGSLGCGGAASVIFARAFGIGWDNKTKWLNFGTNSIFGDIKASNNWDIIKVYDDGPNVFVISDWQNAFQPGDIIDSVTCNVGSPHGHIGIVTSERGPDGTLYIISNSSTSASIEKNYTIKQWFYGFSGGDKKIALKGGLCDTYALRLKPNHTYPR